MADPVTASISVLARAVSVTTAWLTLFRRGTVKMTQPTVIYFGPDGSRGRGADFPPKVYLRALLFSTAKRGRVIESMHVSLARNESHQTFNIWVHGDDKLVRGNGLFIGETGVAASHHFLAPQDASTFQFSAGLYRLEVFARLLGDRKPKLLFSQSLEISSDVATSLKEARTGLYFDWGADSAKYLPHIDRRSPPPELADELAKSLGITSRSSSDVTKATRT